MNGIEGPAATGAAVGTEPQPDDYVAKPHTRTRRWLWPVLGIFVLLALVAGLLVLWVLLARSAYEGGDGPAVDDMQTVSADDFTAQPDTEPVVEGGVTVQVKDGLLLLTPTPGPGLAGQVGAFGPAERASMEASFADVGTTAKGAFGVGIIGGNDPMSGAILVCMVGRLPALLDAGTLNVLVEVGDVPCGPAATLRLEVSGGSGPAMFSASMDGAPGTAYFGDVRVDRFDQAGVVVGTQEEGFVIGVKRSELTAE